MFEDIAYIPISQELIMTIEKLKGKQESVQDFIKKLIEEFAFQQDIELGHWDAPKFWTLLVLGLKNFLSSALFPYFFWCFVSVLHREVILACRAGSTVPTPTGLFNHQR